jgi:hypothetical protein
MSFNLDLWYFSFFPRTAVAIAHKSLSGLQNHPYRLSRSDTSGNYGCRHGCVKSGIRCH